MRKYGMRISTPFRFRRAKFIPKTTASVTSAETIKGMKLYEEIQCICVIRCTSVSDEQFIPETTVSVTGFFFNLKMKTYR